ncbi:hypothetical protein PI20285_08215 [Pediococcus inopinatus]|nr:hypothetical protein PI20285_08215 [Pediococcus inopinatus]
MIFSKLNRKSAILTIALGFIFVLTIFCSIIYNASNLKLASWSLSTLKMIGGFQKTSLVLLAFFLGEALNFHQLKWVTVLKFYTVLLCFSIPLTPLLFSIDVSTINVNTFINSFFPFLIKNYWFSTIIILLMIFLTIFKRKSQEQVSHPAGEVAGQVRISIEGQDNSYALHDLRIRAASI